jgi:hypothetical protein
MVAYSNPTETKHRLLEARKQANLHRQPPAPPPPPRQKQMRLSPELAAELVEAYQAGALVRDLASQFGIHRATASALLVRQGVELRSRGLNPEQVVEACQLYRDGWSLARLGAKFGVDDTTVLRYLRFEGVVMRSPNQRSRG